MSAMKRWAEQLSESLGLQGEITPEVMQIGSLLQKIAAQQGRDVKFIPGGIRLVHPAAPPEMIGAVVHAPGDRSVGIFPFEVEIGGIPSLTPKEDSNGEFRDGVRSLLTEAFRQILDDARAHVIFSDECPDCGKRMVEGQCPNTTGCPSHRPDGD